MLITNISKGGELMNQLFLAILNHRDLLKVMRVAIIASAVIAAMVAPSLVSAGPDAGGP
jgi:hypothetical protein